MRQFKTERAVQQQKLICESLVRLMEEQNYAQITVSDICKHSGIPRRTFYYYYEGKEDALRDLMAQIMIECDLESMISPHLDRPGVEAGLARFFRYWYDRRRRELDAIVRNDLGQMLVQQCMLWLPTERSWESLTVDLPQDRQTIASLLGITCVFYALYYWQNNGYTQSPEQLARNVTELLTNPVYKVDR